ncbi:hypothetical protein B0H17DRAFT_1090706 [Mycena rosella]|uniref:Uncharacterized protein n=1 Tax=Mycena rosella TaxID=1033263 RepID=A0AAD7G6V3_MYCRO|nr:hypothetical protein B0H17DRAFT_1090706 [Mycena rosella]
MYRTGASHDPHTLIQLLASPSCFFPPTMTLVFLANAYRLASLLCVLLIGSAVAAICLYGLAVPSFSEIYLQIMPIGYAIWTLVDIHRLLPYIHRTDTTVSSRVNKHYISLVVHPFVYFEYGTSSSIPIS